jgi:DNA-binding CsgD family transcriptional regulator
MLQHLNCLLGGQVALCGALVPAWKESRIEVVPGSFVGVECATNGDRKYHLPWVEETALDIDPIVRQMAETVCRNLTPATRSRGGDLSDAEWYSSAFYYDFRRAGRLDDRIESFYWHAPSRAVDGLCLVRLHDASPFDDRRRNLLRIFHQEICRLLGTKLADRFSPSVARLSPRLRQVLTCLLEGESEKQVAMRLAISRHTVHEHVKRLHHYFGVASRGELMARCGRLLPVLNRLSDAQQLPVASAAHAFGEAFRLRS